MNKNTKQLLILESKIRNTANELSNEKPDPLMVAKKYNDEYIALICALFAYGNAIQIVKFLNSLDFDLLNQSEQNIRQSLNKHYYRFQNSNDVVEFFISMKRLKQKQTLQSIFCAKYKKKQNVLEGINSIIEAIWSINDYRSDGYKFLVSTLPKRDQNGQIKYIGNSPYKRYNMFLRWMVRNDCLDMGLWTDVSTKDLILPLDTHTFKIGQRLGLLNRKTYDLKSAVLITEQLKLLDQNDPIKYDFALYRIGQEKMV